MSRPGRCLLPSSLLAAVTLLASTGHAAPQPQIYFGSSAAGGGLVRARLDGSALQFVLPAEGTFINAVGVDPVHEKLYYSGGGLTYRADLGGANPEILFEEGFDYLAVDPIAGRIAAARSSAAILADLDGGGRVDIVEGGDFADLDFKGIDVDPITGEVCYGAADLSRTVVRCRAYDESTSYTAYDTGEGSGGTTGLYPVTLDPLRRQVWHGDTGGVYRTDLDTMESDDLSGVLPSFSGRALELDAVAGKLYYRGSPNTLRVIDVDLTDAVELLPEGEPAIARDAALLVPVPVARDLHRLVPLAPGDGECPDGGLRIEFGADDGTPGGTAYNGALEEEEVDSSVTVCGGEDATSCTVTDNGDGSFTLTCPDGTDATWSEGQDGAPGEDGDGGADGEPGADGSSCSVTDNGDGTATITCEDGTEATVGSGGGGCASTEASSAGAFALLLLGLRRRRRR